MRQVPLERDINIAVNCLFLVLNLQQERPFMAMSISRSRRTYLISTILWPVISDLLPMLCDHLLKRIWNPLKVDHSITASRIWFEPAQSDADAEVCEEIQDNHEFAAGKTANPNCFDTMGLSFFPRFCLALIKFSVQWCVKFLVHGFVNFVPALA